MNLLKLKSANVCLKIKTSWLRTTVSGRVSNVNDTISKKRFSRIDTTVGII